MYLDSEAHCESSLLVLTLQILVLNEIMTQIYGVQLMQYSSGDCLVMLFVFSVLFQAWFLMHFIWHLAVASCHFHYMQWRLLDKNLIAHTLMGTVCNFHGLWMYQSFQWTISTETPEKLIIIVWMVLSKIYLSRSVTLNVFNDKF